MRAKVFTAGLLLFIPLVSGLGLSPAANNFVDNFTTTGTKLDTTKWTTETTPSTSFVGRTQLADWVTPGGVGQFVVGGNGAQLTVNTFNPTGNSIYGTHAKTLSSFKPGATTAIVVNTRLQLTTIQPGLIYGMYLSSCTAACTVAHDEISIEIVSNFLQPGPPSLAVNFNRLSAETGIANRVKVNLPGSVDPLAAHNWGIRWTPTTIDYSVDGLILFSTSTHVPQGPMQMNVIAWAPDSSRADAFDSSIAPVSSAGQNRAIISYLTSVKIRTVANFSSSQGFFRSGFLWAEDVNADHAINTPTDRVFALGGLAGDVPITGDWNGDGSTKVGIYRGSNGTFLLDYDGDLQFTSADKVYNLGVGTQANDVPVVGDWDGSGTTKVGLFRQGFFWILDVNGDGVFGAAPDQSFAFGGIAGDVPVVGDWNGDGTSKVGIFRSGFFWIIDYNGNKTIDNVNAVFGDKAFAFGGITGDVPVVGDWNNDGRSKPGVFRQGFFWVLDNNGDYQFSGTDQAFPFGGVAGDKPVVGKWAPVGIPQ